MTPCARSGLRACRGRAPPGLPRPLNIAAVARSILIQAALVVGARPRPRWRGVSHSRTPPACA
eukprot:1159070-Lingulodinium_polyedra.AAC.1